MVTTKPTEPKWQDCKGLMDWAHKMMLYKLALGEYEKYIKELNRTFPKDASNPPKHIP